MIGGHVMTEIIFEVTEDEVNGGYSAMRWATVSTPRAGRLKTFAATSGRPSTATSTRP